MSDTSQGEGWWQASDLKWYPPETHPSYRPPPPAPPRPEPPRFEVPRFESPSIPIPAPAAEAQYPPPPADDVVKRRRLAAYAVAAGAALLIVGSFLPWAKLTAPFFGSITKSGVDDGGDGWITIVLGVALGVVAWRFFVAAKAGKRAPMIVALVVAAAAVGLTVYEWIDIDNALDEAKTQVSAADELPDGLGIDFGDLFSVEQAVGLYVVGVGGLAGGAGALAYKQPAKS